MRLSVRRPAFGATALMLPILLALAGCGGKQAEGNALASLDTRLTSGNASDNASDIVTSNTVTQGAAPAKAAKSRDTLGSLAEAQHGVAQPEPVTQRLAAAAGRPVGGCAGRGLHYGDQWAGAMPEGLGLYPGARLVEAAGTDTGRCALRVMTFTTADSPDSVVTHYATSVRRAGFDAERQPCRAEIRLGGTRTADDAAYMLFARRRNGVTEVDIVASAGHRA